VQYPDVEMEHGEGKAWMMDIRDFGIRVWANSVAGTSSTTPRLDVRCLAMRSRLSTRDGGRKGDCIARN
jgi:hypothetical protein